jgi:uncharacterized protein YdcH (DUF465 family)
MFPEYRELISKLKTADLHFSRLFDQHNALDQRITNIENGIETGDGATIEKLKKEKLRVKDELYVLLKKAAAA